ncbi:huntingtin-interacting protein 1-related protein [Oncorhynchus mykiss]|uniref:huntingtin-interacting protein 1-related protein n=1 Tax=Oncorhynchus mykiss TaxID=8022 RepID=UPI001877AD39|nr:huntingtin-interacting protein 1-related protein [Oncorhynchus mykiss]
MSSSKPKNKSENKTEKQLAAEKEQFGKLQLHSISKSITSSETPLKEKYARNIIMGTHKEGGATTFWSFIINLPLSSNAIISWKFCYMLHKVLRDGHHNAVRDSHRYSRNVKDMGVLWGNLHDRYGHIVSLSAKFLSLKMEFHVKHKVIPGNLEATDETVEREAGTDVNKIFDMTHELLDYLDAALTMSETVWRQLDANAGKSTTPAGQCRLGPLIPVILDCSWLYHFSVKLLFKLHSCVSADSLLGHRERFRDLFNSLTKLFDRARETEFFKKFIQIPDLPDSPPNFLRASALAEYERPVVVMPNEEPYEEVDAAPQPDYSQAPQQPYNMLSQLGAPDAGFDQRRSPSPALTEAEALRKELEIIKPELQLLKTEAQRCVTQLKSQVNRLEAELEDQRTHKQMALVDNEHLRMEVGALRQATASLTGVQAGYQEADGRAQAAELRFSQLKERHAELVTSHADLLKKNAETVRFLSSTQQNQQELAMAKQQLASEVDHLRQANRLKLEQQKQEMDRLNRELLDQRAALGEVHIVLNNKEMAGSQMTGALQGLQREREELLRCLREKEGEVSSLQQQAQLHHSSMEQDRDRSAREMASLRQQLQQQLAINAEQRVEIDRLKRELEQSRAEVSRANNALQNKEMTGSQMNSALMGLQIEKEGLLRSVREKDAELSSLWQQAQLQRSSLEQDNDRTSREMASLRQQLQQRASREGELTRKLQEEQFCLLQCAVVEAEGIILDAVSKLDDPIHVRCTCSPDYLVNRAEFTLGSLDKMQQSHMVYLGNMDDASGLLRAVTQFSHLASDTIVNGGATAHSAPTDQADRLTDSCREASTHCLQFLHELKSRATLHRADPTTIRYVMRRILTMGQDLRFQGQDVLKEELGEMVDKEMTATSTAIEEAVLRMDEILNQARRDMSGVKLEVNQSILGSCSDLMKAIHMLVTAATDLQKDIVESGRGAASVKEFYAKNSCWTEGLISASKSVGWGATQMLDSADKVVTSGGKYEELIVCSHEIAASTAQLVAASKVKADRNSKKLSTLQQASRHVNDMAAIVVTSTNHGQRQITEREPMDFSGISLIKVKTQEIESQVKVLELENQLEQERVRLGELRKKHYQLSETGTTDGGEVEVEVEGGDGDDGGDSFPPPPPPTLLPASTLLPQPYLNTQPFSQTQPDSQLSAQSYSPPKSYSHTQPYSQTKPYSEPESYSQPATQSYSPPQSYSSSQTQSYLPPQSYSQTQSYSPPQTYSQSQPYVNTNPFSQPPPLSQPLSPPLSQPESLPLPNNSVELAKPTHTSKKPSIFQKTGTLFSKFRRGEAGTEESSVQNVRIPNPE